MIRAVPVDVGTMLTAYDGDEDVEVGTLLVIVREVPRNGQAFATKAIARDATVSRALVDAAIGLAREAGASELRLGVSPVQRDRWDLNEFTIEGLGHAGYSRLGVVERQLDRAGSSSPAGTRLPMQFERVYDAHELDFPIGRVVPDPDLTLRVVDDASAETWRDVINRAFADTPNGSTESSEDVARMRREPGSELLLADVDGRAALAAHTLLVAGAFFIESLGVVPEARGAGLGRALVRALVRRAQAFGATRISLHVMDGNACAHGLYLGEGFTPTRIVTHWLRRVL